MSEEKAELERLRLLRTRLISMANGWEKTALQLSRRRSQGYWKAIHDVRQELGRLENEPVQIAFLGIDHAIHGTERTIVTVVDSKDNIVDVRDKGQR